MGLLELPDRLTIKIIKLLTTSSKHPIKDLRNLRAICKCMYKVCKKKHVTQCILVGLAFVSECWDVGEYNGDYRNLLVSKLAIAGNQEVCFCDGLRIIFHVNRAKRIFPLNMLESAANEGHKLVVYMLAMCLYRCNGGAGNEDKAKELVRKVEGEEGSGSSVSVPRRWTNIACVCARYLTEVVVEHYEPPYTNCNWVAMAKPERGGSAHITGCNCGQLCKMV